jgi:MscS family membrane protein
VFTLASLIKEDMDINEVLKTLSGYVGKDPWIMHVFVVVFLTLLVNYLLKRMLNKLHLKIEKTATLWDDAVFNALKKPLNMLIWIIGIAFAINIIRQEAGAAIFDAIDPIRDSGIIATLAWFLAGLITQAKTNIITQREASGEPYDRTTMDAIAKLLRISVMITATLVVLQTLGFSVSGVLAFGGIGGIAIGFAAKDLLANFFGGLMIYLDRPFAVGDWIRSPDRDIEGTVEHIGWRLTRIRTFQLRPLFIPNSTFATIALENPSRMPNRRIYETIGIRYDDASKMTEIVRDVEKMLREHPEINADRTLMVSFNTFAPSSLDFFIYTFTKTKEWVYYHIVKQDILLRILKIIESHGAQVAFPTSTVHVPDGLPMWQEQEEKGE